MSPARILLFTGKGGVGTTTIAAATALRVADAGAQEGTRTALVSAGPISGLADLFDLAPTTGPVAISPGLWVVDPSSAHPGPGTGTGWALGTVDALARSGDWDALVVDGAGTTPPPEQEGVSVRLVVNAERLAIADARRTATRLALHGHAIDEVVVNRILPDQAADPWLDQWRRTQAVHLADLEATFAGTPVRRAPQSSSEVRGVEAVRSLASELYGADDPVATVRGDRPLLIVRTEGGYRLTLAVPFASRDEIELGRRGDELHLTVGGHHRLLSLPDSLRRRSVSDARVRDGCLQVDFVDPP